MNSSGSVITTFRAAVHSGTTDANTFQTVLIQAVSATPSNGDLTVDPNSVTVCMMSTCKNMKNLVITFGLIVSELNTIKFMCVHNAYKFTSTLHVLYYSYK